MMRISDLQAKDVINIIDGKKLGQVMDVDFDLQNGRIQAFSIPQSGKFFGWLGSANECVITWKQIIKIGADVILVRLEDRPISTQEEQELIEIPIKPYRTM
jgi:YlmC/YmxH family sporulation protein